MGRQGWSKHSLISGLCLWQQQPPSRVSHGWKTWPLSMTVANPQTWVNNSSLMFCTLWEFLRRCSLHPRGQKLGSRKFIFIYYYYLKATALSRCFASIKLDVRVKREKSKNWEGNKKKKSFGVKGNSITSSQIWKHTIFGALFKKKKIK